MKFSVPALLSTMLLGSALSAQGSFLNWETPHVHPLDTTPNGALLLAVNLPDNRLEMFGLGGDQIVPLTAIPVGLDPVSVRARSNREVWVVNQVSDSISIVDLELGAVVRTLATDDEPADVVFAGTPERAFVTCSQANTVLVFDPEHLATPPKRLAIRGEDPRALAVPPDGRRVYAAIFESGNDTTVLGGGIAMNLSFPPNVVSDPAGPYGGKNPPPNAGANFSPPINPNQKRAPRVSLIVRHHPSESGGRWLDDNSGDWTALVSGDQAHLSGRPMGWRLLDHDLAIIDTASLELSYATGLMNICMALAVHPITGDTTVVGTEATNEIRFEPNLRGRFVRSHMATVSPSGEEAEVRDLNPHLDYTTGTVPQDQRDLSIADPRACSGIAPARGPTSRAWDRTTSSSSIASATAMGGG